ncbi:cupin domain-containing protein [Botryobacter ruber]|uniref:cupin domain-containing protein n=1 Tax=Botryobacter ruber TaxID=2171629 RepID=UPI00196A849F|nr:cupin domain-containing protein [Botryobacter ruber]
MKTLTTALLLFTASFACSFPLKAQDHPDSQQHDGEHRMLNQQELQWQEGPASLPKGIKVAMLEGDLTKAAPFTIRIQLPANYKIPSHWHPAIEHVTVIKGSFYMGSGDKFDVNKATMLAEGGFAVMPIKYVHFAFTKEAATIQLHGVGPWGITYVNEADDPRNQQK